MKDKDYLMPKLFLIQLRLQKLLFQVLPEYSLNITPIIPNFR